jgi:hypothetical protein
MGNEVSYEKYRKLSVASLVTGILAISFCILYFLAWILFDNLLERLVADYEFMSHFLFLFVWTDIRLTIAAIVTGSLDLKRIKKGTYSAKGKGFDIAGTNLGSILTLFGFTLWFVDFFGFINIIT